MAEDRKQTNHRIVLEDRERIYIEGVVDVLSFDEELVTADTEAGVLLLKGVDLHVNNLNLETGELGVDGLLTSITYEDSDGFVKGKGSMLSKLFK